jgi:hypothetical protein
MSSVSENLKSNIKKWSQIDNKIKETNQYLAKLYEERKRTEIQAIQLMKNERVENASIALGNCKICISNDKTYSNYTQKYIEEQLSQLINNPTTVKKICHHLKSNRKVENHTVLKKSKTMSDKKSSN